MAAVRAVAASLALALSVLAAAGAAAAPERGNAPAERSPSPAPPSAAIPVEEVARRAAEVPDLLRVLSEPLRPSAQVEAIRERLPDVRREIDADLAVAASVLQGQPTLDTLQSQQLRWQRRQLQTTGWLNALTQRATLLQDALNRMAGMQRTWELTRDAARAAHAPAPILQQIDASLAQIREAEQPLSAQRTEVLDLQAAVSHEVSRSSTALTQLTQVQQRAIGGVFVRDSAPVWSAQAWAEARDTMSTRLGQVLIVRWGDIVRYVRDPWRGLAWHFAFLAAVALALGAARRRARELSRCEGFPAAETLDHPFFATAIIGLLVVASPHSPLPPTIRGLFEVLALGAVIALTELSADRRLIPLLSAVWILFAVDNLRETVAGLPVIEQGILMAEMLAGLAVLAQALHRVRSRASAAVPTHLRLLAILRPLGGLFMVAAAVALLAAAFGYLRLARLLASGLLGSGALALVLHAAVRVLSGLIAFALRVDPLRRLEMVRHHGTLLERRIHGVLVALAIVAWVARTLDYVGLFIPAMAIGSAMLATPLGRGSIQISLGDIAEFVLTVWVAYAASAFIRFALSEDVYPRTGLTRGISYAISSLLNYVIIALGFVLALGALGLDLTKVTVLAGALGVGIGFGLQSVVNNFVSGLILLFERPIHVGDVVEVGNLLGEVVRIGIRASIVRTGNGAEMIVPNAQLVTERVTNWTLSDRTRRIDLPVGVDYASPPQKVVEVLEAVARGHPQIMQTPPPQAVFTAFSDSAITFELRAWTNRYDRWPKIRTELAAAVYAALQAAGMTMPFPQREVRVLHTGPALPATGSPDGSDQEFPLPSVRGGPAPAAPDPQPPADAPRPRA